MHTPSARAVDWLADRFAGVPLVYVLGNHDLCCDRKNPLTCFDLHEQAKERGAARNIHVLVEEAVELAGVRSSA